MPSSVLRRNMVLTSYDAILKEVHVNRAVTLQRLCQFSSDLRANKLTLHHIGIKGGLWCCVQHKTHHMFDLTNLSGPVVYDDYSRLTSGADNLHRLKRISDSEYKHIIELIDEDRKYFRSILDAARLNHGAIRRPLIDAVDRARARKMSTKNKKKKSSAKKPSKVAARNVSSAQKSVPMKRQPDPVVVTVQPPPVLIMQSSQLSDEMLLEYYRCFRKKLHYSEKEAYETLRNHAHKDSHLMGVYMCEFCTGYHTGHKPLPDMTNSARLHNARNWWTKDVKRSNAFVEYMSDLGFLKPTT